MGTISEDLKKIENSKIKKVFTPAKPMVDNFFCGREDEIRMIVDSLNTSGCHVVLFGDRGVGKTSLAGHACKYYQDEIENKAIVKVSCDSSDTFESVVGRIFKDRDIVIKENIQTETSVGYAETGIKKTETIHNTVQNFTPAWVVEKLKKEKCIIIIDEFDMLTDQDEKKKFSQFIKILSDSDDDIDISLLIVGIALSIDELMKGHASIDRCLTQVHLNRMSEEELLKIIKNGEKETKLHFEKDVKNEIVSTSLGFPYYVHLLALETSKVAVLDNRKKVTTDDFEKGLKEALKSVDQSLKHKYDNAIAQNGSISQKKVLYAAAKVGDKGIFTMRNWIETYNNLYGEDIKNVNISNAAHIAMSKSGDTLLQIVKKGLYIFNDSRIPCYIMMLGKPE